MTADEFAVELLTTVVVGAEDEETARGACADLIRRTAGRVVQSVDCSDEEPGCRSVTLARTTSAPASANQAAALSRAVRELLNLLGPGFTGARVSCEPPSAWTVIDDPALVGSLVTRGDRMLVEAWSTTGGTDSAGDATSAAAAGPLTGSPHQSPAQPSRSESHSGNHVDP
ncbi:hypothetical protein [Actinopolyspora halophila]|uniref:hypothetical protein n=1 Tax=Actinopolyspora halophila TaxID=1850 RepID=UPI00035CC01C|nr:hypothetical protein [Actinopolyspora halophila]